MKTSKAKLKRSAGTAATLAAVFLLATACARIEPMEYTEIHEIQPGPGLLSGEEGSFVLYGN